MQQPHYGMLTAFRLVNSASGAKFEGVLEATFSMNGTGCAGSAANTCIHIVYICIHILFICGVD